MPKKFYRQATFLTSSAKVSQLPDDIGIEVAFAGCSNSGKSSTLNALTDNKHLARTSKTPGRTQLINLFSLDEERRLVDLPGYGYAKVSGNVRAAWKIQLDLYLRERTCLKGLVLVSDIRHPLKPFEEQMIEWAVETKLPLLLILNKADKLSRNEVQKTFFSVKKTLSEYSDIVTVCCFSAVKRTGLDDVCVILDRWFALS